MNLKNKKEKEEGRREEWAGERRRGGGEGCREESEAGEGEGEGPRASIFQGKVFGSLNWKHEYNLIGNQLKAKDLIGRHS